MTSDHDMIGMLRGARKRLRQNSFFKRGKLVSSRVWADKQTRLWAEFYVMLERAYKQGVVSDVGLNHLRNRENVIRKNWGCKP
jgi:hypothetical protein